MEIDIKGIVVIVGNYGSGKTETAANLAFFMKQSGMDVAIVDLDLVNPYFRTREGREGFEKAGINVILPDTRYLNADLPILSPKVAGILRNPAGLTILDAGGDDVGATVLSALKDSLEGKNVSMIQVINPFRPFTGDVDGCIRIKEQIEKSSNLEVTAVAGNANLIDDTTLETLYQGYELLEKVSEATGLPIQFITWPSHLLNGLDGTRITCPVLPIERGLVMPWNKNKYTKRSINYGI
ncbi:MAG: cobalamin biosynthesis protein CbiA [Desulfobacteraceae bacterium]